MLGMSVQNSGAVPREFLRPASIVESVPKTDASAYHAAHLAIDSHVGNAYRMQPEGLNACGMKGYRS